MVHSELVPFLEMSSSTSCMKLATSGGSLWISLSLRPSFRRFSSLKKGCKHTLNNISQNNSFNQAQCTRSRMIAFEN